MKSGLPSTPSSGWRSRSGEARRAVTYASMSLGKLSMRQHDLPSAGDTYFSAVPSTSSKIN